jgi:hypothetical protein
MDSERANLITDVKNQILVEGMRGLFLINGGGAVALATWLQAVWDKEWAAPMLWWHLCAMAAFALGVFFGAFVPLWRYLVFLYPRRDTPKQNPWWWAHVLTTVFSILSFAVASGLVVKGGFAALEKQAAMAPNKPLERTSGPLQTAPQERR